GARDLGIAIEVKQERSGQEALGVVELELCRPIAHCPCQHILNDAQRCAHVLILGREATKNQGRDGIVEQTGLNGIGKSPLDADLFHQERVEVTASNYVVQHLQC